VKNPCPSKIIRSQKPVLRVKNQLNIDLKQGAVMSKKGSERDEVDSTFWPKKGSIGLFIKPIWFSQF